MEVDANASECVKKPIPNRVGIQGGHSLLVEPADVVKKAGHGGMNTFSREFWHPGVHIKNASGNVVKKYFVDNRRFPPCSYEDSSLVWRGEYWMQLFPDEREVVLGLPKGATGTGVDTPGRNSMTGNGFHMQSIMLMLFCLFASDGASVIGPLRPLLYDADVLRMRHAVWGTAFSMALVGAFPSAMGSTQTVDALKSIFEPISGADAPWDQVGTNLAGVRLNHLHVFWIDAYLRGVQKDEHGPQ